MVFYFFEYLGIDRGEGAEIAYEMLSFTKGRPIGYISEGEHKDERICINSGDPEPKAGKKTSPVVLLGHDYFKKLRKESGKKLTVPEVRMIIEHLISGDLPEQEDLQGVYTAALDRYTEVDKAEILLDDGKVIPIPNFECDNEDQVENIYIVGPSGVGKSRWIAAYCDMWRLEYPERRIVIFSRLAADKALEHLNPERKDLKGDEKKKIDIGTVEDYKDSICIFDDVDAIQDKRICEQVLAFRDSMLETGRHSRITTLSVSHQAMNYKKTSACLNEATAIVFFPRGGSVAQIRRMLSVHGSCNAEQARKVMRLPSRWIVFQKRFPQYFLHERGALSFDALDDVGKKKKKAEEKKD